MALLPACSHSFGRFFEQYQAAMTIEGAIYNTCGALPLLGMHTRVIMQVSHTQPGSNGA